MKDLIFGTCDLLNKRVYFLYMECLGSIRVNDTSITMNTIKHMAIAGVRYHSDPSHEEEFKQLFDRDNDIETLSKIFPQETKKKITAIYDKKVKDVCKDIMDDKYMLELIDKPMGFIFFNDIKFDFENGKINV